MIYDKFARFYDRAFAPLEDRFLAGWRAEALRELSGAASILEIGAGTGANFAFYPRTNLAVASEISIKMLEAARPKRRGHKLVQADAQDLPFGGDVFDAAIATLVFCSIPEPTRAFAELRRVVRADGVIVLLEHVRPDGALGIAFDVFNTFTVALVCDHFNRRTAQIAKVAGLSIIDVRRRAAGAVNLIICRNQK